MSVPRCETLVFGLVFGMVLASLSAVGSHGGGRGRWGWGPLADHMESVVVSIKSFPPTAEQRPWLTPGGNIRYPLKTPYRDGTKHVI
jgi:hypothetical protein